MTRFLPILPLRDIVVFPHRIVPLFVGREKSVAALEAAMASDKELFLVAQLDPGEDDPDRDAMYDLGVIATAMQLLKLPDGTVRVLVEGVKRARLVDLVPRDGFVAAEIEEVEEEDAGGPETQALMRSVIEQFENYAKLNKRLPAETGIQLGEIEDPSALADAVASNLSIKVADKQALLGEMNAARRLEMVFAFMEGELGVLQVEKKIRSRVKRQMEKTQREYYLNEQLKAIQRELGNESDEGGDELAELAEKIRKTRLSKEARTRANAELKKLRAMAPMSAEATVARNYLDVLLGLPWGKKSKLKKDIAEAQRVLDEDHYGLEKVKERIVEYLAVQARTNKLKGPILCLVGPPGVGKTSLGRSIARATGREFVRQSLGGVRDEAEIRGHRRTYVGAMPGRVIKALKDAKSRNPVMVLDEIDKVGSDAFRGDPSSALLEVLDPEQNTTFSDHYLEVPFDLSKVIFITTANLLEPIPPALRDRMEIIEVSGYTEVEKMAIGRQFLLPKTLETHGLTPEQLTVTDDALRRLIREYTEESGVRNLEREIGSLCRKVARILAGDSPPSEIMVDAPQVSDYLGIPKYDYGLAEEQDEIGVATGAAVTSVGGDLLGIEVLIMPGKGDLILTGQLGDVMQESARAALSYARARTGDYGLAPDFFDRHNIHVHVPAGAIPKDGPSAGITMATALISALTGRQVRKDVAMTGEITLRGKVLPIGGLREKTVAAHRGGIKTFILPRRNAKDLAELPGVVRDGMELIQVDSLEQVLAAALLPKAQAGPVPVQVA